MNPAHALPRRTVLAVSGTAVLAVAAACSSNDPAPAAGTTAAGTTAGSASAAKSSSAAVSTGSAKSSAVAAYTTASGTATSPVAPAGDPLASVADVEAAGSMVIDGGQPILLAAVNGTVVAHTAICTHQGCTVAAKGSNANCPCHGSKFNAATGAVLNGPAQSPLAEVTVTVADGKIYAG